MNEPIKLPRAIPISEFPSIKVDRRIEWITARLSELTPILENPANPAHLLARKLLVDISIRYSKDVEGSYAEKKKLIHQKAVSVEREKMKKSGPLFWKKLHQRALHHGSRNDEEWVGSFVESLPCGSCKNHFREIVSEYPPVFSIGFDYFAWTVDVHNMVNKSLGYPEMTREAAMGIWQSK